MLAAFRRRCISDRSVGNVGGQVEKCWRVGPYDTRQCDSFLISSQWTHYAPFLCWCFNQPKTLAAAMVVTGQLEQKWTSVSVIQHPKILIWWLSLRNIFLISMACRLLCGKWCSSTSLTDHVSTMVRYDDTDEIVCLYVERERHTHTDAKTVNPLMQNEGMYAKIVNK